VQSLAFGSTCPQIYGDSGGEFKSSLGAVNERAVQSVPAGVVAATHLSVKYSLLSLDKSYASKDNSPYPEAVAEGEMFLC
jgi:hypothetical protein